MAAIQSVPTIYERQRIPENVIKVVQAIAERFAPQQIVLFGSYAARTERPESDVDLLIIIETDRREIEVALDIRRWLQPQFALDLVVITPERLKQRISWGDSFLREILHKGIVLYESVDQ
ncbi:MAG: nucleotidyltransferase domain-containing protein [Anaerolineae bacterium]